MYNEISIQVSLKETEIFEKVSKKYGIMKLMSVIKGRQFNKHLQVWNREMSLKSSD